MKDLNPKQDGSPVTVLKKQNPLTDFRQKQKPLFMIIYCKNTINERFFIYNAVIKLEKEPHAATS